MDQQDDERRTNRNVSRAQRNNQRRNLIVQRRNLVHYRVHNIAGNVTITNNFYFDMNGVPLDPNTTFQLPAILPSSLPLPFTVYGPNQTDAGNIQVSYVPPPVPYVPTQATHIAIPLTHLPTSRGMNASPPQILNGATARFVNVTSSHIMNVTPPQMMNVRVPGVVNGTAPGFVSFPSPRQGSVVQPQNTSSTAYIVTQIGNFVTQPSTTSAPSPMYIAIPSTTHSGAVSYAYSNTTPPSPIPNGARITPVENVAPVDEVSALTITEVLPSNGDEELN